MTGAWFFEVSMANGDVLAVEPDGTRHNVPAGDMRTVSGVRLLNRMVAALTTPAEQGAAEAAS